MPPGSVPSSRAYSWALVLPALGAWGVALVLLGCSARTGTITAVLAALAVAAILWVAKPSHACRLHRWAPALRHQLWRNVAVATLTCMAATAASVAFRVHTVTTGPVADLAAKGLSATFEITLTGDPKIRTPAGGRFHRDQVVVPADVDILQTGHTRLAVRAPVVVFAGGPEWRTLLPSQRLEVTGRLAQPTPGDLTAAILLVRGPPRVLSTPTWTQSTAGILRAGLRGAADVLPPDQRGLLPGLVVGDVSRMDPHVADDLKEAGLSHLNAVSGANLAIIAGATLALSRLAGLPLALRAVLAAIAMLAFAVVARPSPSVLRALLMGLVAALALGTGRAKDGVAALSVSVLLLILFDPELARSYGFALSVSATAGILLLAPRWRDRLASDPQDAVTGNADTEPGRRAEAVPVPTKAGRTRRCPLSLLPNAGAGAPPRRRVRLPRWAAEAVAVPAAAQAAVTPVLVLMSGQLTLVAVPANLLAGPAVAPATLLGFVAALIAPLWPEAAQVLVIPAGYAVGWIITVARRAVDVPFATVPWPGGLLGLGLLAVVVAVAVPVLRRRTWRVMALTVTGAALVAVLVVRPLAAPWPPKGWLMVMCDVGQGDGMVLAAGPGRGIVVDTGPDPVTMDRCLDRLDIREVPLILLTHPHADHVDGLPGVLRDRRVGAVVVSPQHVAMEQSARISAILARRRIPEWKPPPGSRWRLGPSDLTILAPEPPSSEAGQGNAGGQGEGSVINNASVVALVRWRAGSALLSGDIEIEAQGALLRGLVPHIDVLKVPHHGSSRQDPAFLAAVGARAALVSVGADNDYGHPALSTVARLRRNGAHVYRTDQSGDLAVVDRDGELAVISRGL